MGIENPKIKAKILDVDYAKEKYFIKYIEVPTDHGYMLNSTAYLQKMEIETKTTLGRRKDSKIARKLYPNWIEKGGWLVPCLD